MISVEYIVDNDKSLLTIMFNSFVLNKLKTKCDDYLNFYQSKFKLNSLTIFKADTGYKISRIIHKRKIYKIQIPYKLEGISEFENQECSYFVKKNGFIKLIIKGKVIYWELLKNKK